MSGNFSMLRPTADWGETHPYFQPFSSCCDRIGLPDMFSNSLCDIVKPPQFLIRTKGCRWSKEPILVPSCPSSLCVSCPCPLTPLIFNFYNGQGNCFFNWFYRKGPKGSQPCPKFRIKHRNFSVFVIWLEVYRVLGSKAFMGYPVRYLYQYKVCGDKPQAPLPQHLTAKTKSDSVSLLHK